MSETDPDRDARRETSRFTDGEKLAMYEGLLHDIQMYRFLVDDEKVGRLIDNICGWSYAHRSGNGELSESEQQKFIERAFSQLRALN